MNINFIQYNNTCAAGCMTMCCCMSMAMCMDGRHIVLDRGK